MKVSNNIILLSLVAVLTVSLLFTLLKIYSLTGINLIPTSQAKRLIQSGVITTIIDVRTSEEYETSHYPNSINIPVHMITGETTKELNKDSTLLIYCNTGQRARYAVNKFKKLGFKNVFYIETGYETLL